MEIIPVLLLVAAAVVFALAAIQVTSTRINLTALGLLLWVLAPLYNAVT